MMILLELSVILILLIGIGLFREPRQARAGNLAAALALLGAMLLVLWSKGIVDAVTVVVALGVGAIAGYLVAIAVNMTQIPAMVALQHGAGSGAACLVALVELARGGHSLDPVGLVSGVIGLAVGALTCSASLIATVKLTSKKWQTPQVLPAHTALVAILIVIMLTVGAASVFPSSQAVFLYLIQIALALVFGILFAIRVGGADMPVLISFLNAMTGLAAALCGMVIGNRLLIAFGATVAASGSVLTYLMCRAMNRRLIKVFVPDLKKQTRSPLPEKQAEAPPPAPSEPANPALDAATALASAKKVIIVPGYGLALSKAQFKLVELASLLSKQGAVIKFAIHPVAGRMPGHMNVILAEAEVDYDDLIEMDEANPLFAEADVAMVIGACDVVNPAAINSEGTPISGMPVLTVQDAGKIIICNFDTKPGYSGVPNPLYENSRVTVMLGDAKASLDAIISELAAIG